LADIKKTALPLPKDLITGAIDKQASKSRVQSVIDSINGSIPDGQIVAGERLELMWPGMKLLTLNELLRIDHRLLTSYRHACHEAVKNAAWELAGRTHSLKFTQPVVANIFRSGKRMVDTDGLYASFKFLIDGLRRAGIIRDDDPLNIVAMSHTQVTGDPAIGLTLTVAQH
jgi:hypothetical protein